MRKTKIICTIGPATCSIEMLEKLYKAGMNVVRLNMSHGDHDWHARVIRAVQKLNRRVKYTVQIKQQLIKSMLTWLQRTAHRALLLCHQ